MMVEITPSQGKIYRPNQGYSLEFLRTVDFGQPGEHQQAPWVSREVRMNGRQSLGKPENDMLRPVCGYGGFLLSTQLPAQGQAGKAGLGSSAGDNSDVNCSDTADPWKDILWFCDIHRVVKICVSPSSDHPLPPPHDLLAGPVGRKREGEEVLCQRGEACPAMCRVCSWIMQYPKIFIPCLTSCYMSHCT